MKKEEFLEELDELRFFEKLTVRTNDQNLHDVELNENTKLKLPVCTIFLLFNDGDKNANKSVQKIIDREPVKIDVDYWDYGTNLNVKDILLKNNRDFYRFLENVDNESNIKLMNYFNLNVEKINNLVSKCSLNVDFEDFKEMAQNKEIDKTLIDRVARRHMDSKKIKDVFTKYKLWKHVSDKFNDQTIDYSMLL